MGLGNDIPFFIWFSKLCVFACLCLCVFAWTREALFAQENGLEFYHRILKDAEKYLNGDGLIFFEIDAYQKDGVSKLAEQYNDKIIDIKQDYNDFDRVLILKNNT